MQRRTLFQLIGLAGLGGAAATRSASASTTPPFPLLPGPIPLASDGLSAADQRRRLQRLSIEDRLQVPAGFRADVLVVWGDPLAEGRFGYNNDYIAFTDLGGDRGLLSVNFEYVSPRPWAEGFQEAVGVQMPLEAVRAALSHRGGAVDAASLASDDPLRRQIDLLARAAMDDLGIGVLELRRRRDGGWSRQPGELERRITGLSGLEDPARRLRVSGPAAVVFRSSQRLGYDDGLGDAVVGTFANCAGGQTPWGTVLSAEENFQNQVVEPVFADGSAADPALQPFRFDGDRLGGLGNPFGLAGNKYGWMVELDPRRPDQPAVKHSWLGRCRHEAVAVRARPGEPLVAYSGCDRHGGHLYRFVSRELVADPLDPANSLLFEQGRLEVARFEPGGGGRWIALAPDTPVDPQLPSHFEAFDLQQPTRLPHPDRSRAGGENLASDAAVLAYRSRYPALGSLYPGSGEQQMGAILIDAHLAANAVGATAAARPEDTVLDPSTGDLLIAFTAAGADLEGRSDPAIFSGPSGEAHWPHGWVMRLSERAAPAAERAGGRFSWRLAAVGGAPWRGGLGFSNPDNLNVDRQGNVWMVTDRSTRSERLDLFGNNSCWLLPSSGPSAGQALLFASGPMECEFCGPCFDSGETTLFLAVQHPGENHGTGTGMVEVQAHELVDGRGAAFSQLRTVPLGSNWPSCVPGRPPRPGLVAIRRGGGGPLLG
ncbi:MAG: alkaline phosphatase PhoX [Cyanobacteria bacterium J06638_7]